MKPKLLLLLLFFAPIIHAQTNSYKGKVYLQDNALLEGFIRFSAYDGTPQEFSFSATEKGESRKMSAASVKKLQLEDGTVYEKFFISIYAINKAELYRLSMDYADVNLTSGEYLLEKRLSGPVSLYRFVDKYSYPHFFFAQQKDVTVTYLRNNSFVEENNIIREDKAYQTSIAQLAAQINCSALTTSKTNKLQYLESTMIKTFQTLNECAGAKVAVAQNAKLRLNAGVVIGAGAVSIDDDQYGRTVQPLFGGFINLVPTKKFKNYTIGLEVLYQGYSNSTDSLISVYERGKKSIKMSTLHINPVATFLLSPKKVSPFLMGGLDLMYIAKYASTYEFKNVYGNTESRQGSLSSQFFPGVLVGVGVDLERLSVSARYNTVFKSKAQGFDCFGLVAKLKLVGQ